MPLLDLKTDLKSIKYGQDRPDGGSSKQPYIKTDINDIDRGFNRLRLNKFDDGLIRGGVIGSTNAAVTDTLRIGKFLTDAPKGPLFIVKQIGLQLSNPRLESKQVKADRAITGGGFLTNAINFVANVAGKIENAVGPTRIYNLGVNTLAQIPINHIGGHVVRHGFLPTQDPSKYYEAVVTANNQNGTNRLEGLATKFQLGDRQTSTVNPNTPKAINSILGLISKVTGAKIPPIKPAQLTIANYIGGPGSVYGIGNTLINRTSFTEDKFKYDTAIANSKDFAGRTRDKNGNSSVVQIKNTIDFKLSEVTGSILTNRKWENPKLPSSFIEKNALESDKNSNFVKGGLGTTFNRNVPVKILTTYDIGPISFNYYTSSNLVSGSWGNIPTTSGSFITNNANANDTGSRTQVGENITDIANYNAPSSYPSNNGKGSIQQDDVYANRLSLPNLAYSVGAAATYAKIASINDNQNLNSNYNLKYGNSAKQSFSINNQKVVGEQLPKNGKANPTYTNTFGDKITINNPWNKVTREKRVGSGRRDSLNLTPIFSDTAGSIGDIPGSKTVAGLLKIPNTNVQTINDLVKFRIQAIDNDNPLNAKWMIFRAFLTDLSDNVDATWNPVKYAGRGEKFYIYDGFTRKMSVSFKVAALSSKEMEPMYQKLNYLMSNLMPDYNENNLMRGPLMRMTIGNYIDGQLCILDSLSYKIPQDSPWEIGLGDKELILPHVIEVTLGFIPIGSQTRSKNKTPQKSECISNIAQNWNGGGSEREYIVPCPEDDQGIEPVVPPTPVVPPPPTPNPPGPGPGPIPKSPIIIRKDYNPQKIDNTRYVYPPNPNKVEKRFQGFGGGRSGGGGASSNF
jgi:hypothetical protein